VGQYEHPLPCVWRAQRASWEKAGTGSVSKPSEVAENIGAPTSKQTGHILGDHPVGPESVDDAGHGRPEPAFVRLAKT
jgi:hypothetical protein